MFVCSCRASSLRFFGIIALTVAVLITAVAVGRSGDAVAASGEVEFMGVETNEDRVAFISRFGIKVSEREVESVTFSVPKDFDKVIAEYNEIQRAQGFDISKYKNKKVTRYTYVAENYPDAEGTVYVNLLVYKDTVVGADVSSADPRGFVKPLVKIEA